MLSFKAPSLLSLETSAESAVSGTLLHAAVSLDRLGSVSREEQQPHSSSNQQPHRNTATFPWSPLNPFYSKWFTSTHCCNPHKGTFSLDYCSKYLFCSVRSSSLINTTFKVIEIWTCRSKKTMLGYKQITEDDKMEVGVVMFYSHGAVCNLKLSSFCKASQLSLLLLCKWLNGMKCPFTTTNKREFST